jgi:hypothetical protein
MMTSIASSMTQCELVEWIQIAVLTGIGLFSLIFLGLGAAMLAKYLVSSDRAKQRSTA